MFQPLVKQPLSLSFLRLFSKPAHNNCKALFNRYAQLKTGSPAAQRLDEEEDIDVSDEEQQARNYVDSVLSNLSSYATLESYIAYIRRLPNAPGFQKLAALSSASSPSSSSPSSSSAAPVESPSPPSATEEPLPLNLQLFEERGGLFGRSGRGQHGEEIEIEQQSDDTDEQGDDTDELSIDQIVPQPYKLLVGCLLTHVWLVHLELLMAEYLRIEAEFSRSIDYWSSYLRDSWFSANHRSGYSLQQRGRQRNLTATLHNVWCVFQRGPVYWSRYLVDRSLPSPLEDARRKLKSLRESRASLLNQLGFAYLIIHQASTEQDIVGLLQHHLPPGGSLYDRLLQGMSLSRREAQKFRAVALRCAKPPFVQRHWLAIAAVSAGSCLAYSYAVKRVPRAQQAIEEVKLYVRSFWNEHVMNRAAALFSTITGQATFQSSVSVESVASSEQSLQRMVVDFYVDKHPNASETSLAEIRELSGRGDISFVMTEYEKILREGSFSLLSFSFVRLLLIQVQKQVLEFERALFSMDKLLSANELLFSMLAAVPTILIGYFVPRYFIKTTWRLVTRPASRREVRTNLLDCERLLLEADNSLQHLGLVSTLIHRMYCLRHLFSSEEQQNYIQALIELQCLALLPRNRVAKTAAVTRIFRSFRL